MNNTADPTRLRIALIGLGMAVTPHARSLIDLADRVEVAHAFSPTAARRAAFTEKFPSFPLTDSLDRIVDDPGVDAAIVLTPPNTHLEMVARCAAAGKHVLVEKPLEVDTGRAGEMVRACRRAGRRLGVVLQHRFWPAARRLRQILDSGRLGDIAGCSTHCRLWRPQSYYDQPGRGTLARDGGGVLMTQAIHTLDLMLSLAGPIVEVTGYRRTSPLHRMETEDMVGAAVRYANGAIGTIDATTAAYPGAAEHVELICRHGTARLVGSGLEVAYHDGEAESVAPQASSGGTGADPMDFPHDAHRDLIGDFLDALAADRDPQVTGEEALKVHRLIDALTFSNLEGGTTRMVKPDS